MAKMKTIVLTGPESTGKSWLSGLLADHFQTTWLPEYLREFYDRYDGIEKEQMETVARRQIALEDELLTMDFPVVFFDTNIISLKVYHEYYFNEQAAWFDNLYDPSRYHHYYLLNTDIPWQADSQRSSPEERDNLYPIFRQQLNDLNIACNIISGNYRQRWQQVKALTSGIIK